MVRSILLFVVAALIAPGVPAAALAAANSPKSDGAGYAMAFNGQDTIMSMRRGSFDLSAGKPAAGIEDAFTACVWNVFYDDADKSPYKSFAWTFQSVAQPNLIEAFVGAFQSGWCAGGDCLTMDFAGPKSSEWAEYCMTWSVGVGGGMQLYLNGEEVPGGAAPVTPLVDVDDGADALFLFFGANVYDMSVDMAAHMTINSKMNHFGAMDEFRLWKGAKSAADIARIHGEPGALTADGDLVVHYSFDGWQPGDVLDNGAKFHKNMASTTDEYDLVVGALPVTGRQRKPSSTGAVTEWGTASRIRSGVPGDFAANVLVRYCPPDVRARVDGSVAADDWFQLDQPTAYAKLLAACDCLVSGTECLANDGSGMSEEEVGSGANKQRVRLESFPALVPEQFDENILESEVARILIPRSGGATIGVHVEVVIKTPPTYGKLYAMKTVEGTGTRVNTTHGTIETDTVLGELGAGAVVPGFGGWVAYEPDRTAMQKAVSFEYAFRYNGWTGPSATVTVHIQNEDDKPTVESPATALELQEDSGGHLLELAANDADGHKVGVFISKLPSRGKLYRTLDGTVEGAKKPDGSFDPALLIDEPYSEFATSKPIVQQYPDKIVRSSSFWGNPPAMGYHAMNLIGPPQCAGNRRDTECTDKRVFSPTNLPEVGSLIRALRDSSEIEKAVGKVGGNAVVHSHNEAAGTVCVEFLPMFRHKAGGTDLERCVMTATDKDGKGPTSKHPADCSPEIARDMGLTTPTVKDIKCDLPSSLLATVLNGVWSPLNREYKGSERQQCGEACGAYGKRFEYDYVQEATYTSPENTETGVDAGADIPYTEWVEVGFAEKVFVKKFELGAPRGRGDVVGVHAKDPDGKWARLYEGQVMTNVEDKLKAMGKYWQWSPQVCNQFFLTDTLRVQIDTSAETGIGEWNYIDYVKLIGSPNAQNAALRNKFVVYVPDKDEFGPDQFSYAATDCPGNAFRSSDTAEVNIVIQEVQDTPTAEDFVTRRGFFDAAYDQGVHLDFAPHITDPDNTAQGVEVDRTNEGTDYGHIVDVVDKNGGLLGVTFTLHNPDAKEATTNAMSIQETKDCCKAHGTCTRSVRYKPRGATVWSTATATIDCALSYDIKDTHDESTASLTSYTCGSEDELPCNGRNGTCTWGGCTCRPNWYGTNCKCGKNYCNGHGKAGPGLDANGCGCECQGKDGKDALASSAWHGEHCEKPFSQWSLGDGMRSLIVVINALGVAFIVAIITMLVKHRNGRVVCFASFKFCMIISVTSALGLVFNMSFALDKTDGVCKAQVALQDACFAIVLGGIFTKTYRIAKMFSNKKLQRIKITDNDLGKMVAAIFFGEVAIVVVWLAVSPPQAELAFSANPLEVYLTCSGSHDAAFRTLDYAYKSLLLLWGVTVTLQTRNVASDLFNESKYIALAIYTVALLAAILLPVVFALDVDPTAQALFSCVGIWFAVVCVNATLFLPKVLMIHQYGTDGPKKVESSNTSGTVTVDSLGSSSDLIVRQTQALEALSAQNKKLKEKVKAMKAKESKPAAAPAAPAENTASAKEDAALAQV